MRSSLQNTCPKEPLIANPTPPLAVFEVHIEELDAAQSEAFSSTRASAEARTARKEVVPADRRHVWVLVQGVYDASHDPAAIIEP